MKITAEMIQALAWLRKGWDGDNSEQAIDALNTLDNAGIFAAIDEATGYDIDPESQPVSKCTCTQLHRGAESHDSGCPGDPAEWGGLAYTSNAGGKH